LLITYYDVYALQDVVKSMMQIHNLSWYTWAGLIGQSRRDFYSKRPTQTCANLNCALVTTALIM